MATVAQGVGRLTTPAIDLHSHLFLSAWLRLARSEGERLQTSFYRRPDGREFVRAPGDFDYPLGEELWSLGTLDATLAGRGLSAAALSVAPPTLSYWAEPGLGAEVARALNEDLRSAVRSRPDRYVALCTVPLQDAARAVRELEWAVRQPEFHGVMVGSNVGGRNLDDPGLWAFWEAAAALDACVFVHPYDVAGRERMQRYYLWNLVGMVTETALAITSLIFGGVYARLPALRTYFAHGGGTYPWLRGRADHGFRVLEHVSFATDAPPASFRDRIYVDNLCFLPEALGFLAAELGCDHIAVGSDYPFDMGPRDPTAIVRTAPGLSGADQEAILWRTAATLLRLDPAWVRAGVEAPA